MIINKANIASVLESMGYTVKDCGSYIKANAHYRGGSDTNSIVIYKDTLRWFDYPANTSGKINDLIKLSDPNASIEVQKIKEREKESYTKTYDDAILNDLLPEYSFFLKRGISENTQKIFEAGFVHGGKMNSRVVFPIRNFGLNVIGFAGRTTRANSEELGIPKWKIIGVKKTFVYPWWISDSYISECSSVLITEGISDILSLYENNIRNTLCLFGLNISEAIINYLISKNVKKIIIATNNEDSGHGNEAAVELQKELSILFDDVKIILPLKKDFALHDMNDWSNYKKIANII